MSTTELKRSLTPVLLWGLGVGYVISGMYFGWNLGLEQGGTLGMAIATGIIIVLYVCFTFSYCELACAIPRAGGAFDYARRALGSDLGFIAGVAQNIEFIFAPPAIAFAIGAYFNLFFPQLPIIGIAIFIYSIFSALNAIGVKAAASFELIVTIFAVGELLLFAGLTIPHAKLEHLTANAFQNGWSGVLAAIPFAIWFFLGIEGVANVAEEAIRPQRTILIGFGSAIATLVLLCVLTFVGAVGVAGWPAVVYRADGSSSDSPLPLALAKVVGANHAMYHLLITVGLFGLIASFHGLILAACRATMEFGRARFAPAFLGRVHPKTQTPVNALLVNMVIGIIALLTGRSAEIIILSVFGALTLYAISMNALLRLRKNEPDLERPFRVPFYPAVPIIALVLSLLSLLAMTLYNLKLALLYFLIVGIGYGLFKMFYRKPKPSLQL